jgi:hypothetical protein
MPSGFTRRLFTNVCPFWVLGTDLSLLCPIRRAGMARRFIPLQTATYFFRYSPSPWVRFFGSRRRPTSRCRSPCRFFSLQKFTLQPLP